MERDRVEYAIRRFHALETASGASPVIDYDCAPTTEPVEPYPDRMSAAADLADLAHAVSNESPAQEQVQAHSAYLAALLGEQRPLSEYVASTQGCGTSGWSEEYFRYRFDVAQVALANVEVGWSERTRVELRAQSAALEPGDVRGAINGFASEFEPGVRDLTGSDAEFRLKIEDVDTDAYWSYWLDGAGHDARLRINVRNAAFTRDDAYRFALHEVLGHALQYASLTSSAERTDVDWPRLLAVHSTHQVLCEGLAQILPLAFRPDDPIIRAGSHLDHYVQLVRAELHTSVNSGATISECTERARSRAPFLSIKDIERELRDRSRDPQLRSYLWAYPAGVDWFMNLYEQRAKLFSEVLRAAYERPLSPSDLQRFWPDGPRIGGDR